MMTKMTTYTYTRLLCSPKRPAPHWLMFLVDAARLFLSAMKRDQLPHKNVNILLNGFHSDCAPYGARVRIPYYTLLERGQYYCSILFFNSLSSFLSVKETFKDRASS